MPVSFIVVVSQPCILLQQLFAYIGNKPVLLTLTVFGFINFTGAEGINRILTHYLVCNSGEGLF